MEPSWKSPGPAVSATASGCCTSPASCVPVSRFELVKGLLPEEYHKVLVNIRKAEARAKRHRALNQAAMEDESQEEEEEPAQGKGDRSGLAWDLGVLVSIT